MEEIFYMKHIHLINSLSLDETTKFTKKRQVNTIQIQNSSLMIEKLLPLINSCDKKVIMSQIHFQGMVDLLHCLLNNG